LVIRYSYLWHAEYLRGQEEGVKDRPCAVVMVVQDDNGEQTVTVLPVTHAPPADQAAAVEIPPETKRRLGLDEQRSWVVIAEANRFAWPGPDLRPAEGGDAASVAYGFLPRALYNKIRERFVAIVASRAVAVVSRTD
jgi:hypothetical protein